MFSVLINKQSADRIFQLKACGVSSGKNEVVWNTPMEYMLAKYFVDRLNECGLPEEELFDATHAFLVEVERLGE